MSLSDTIDRDERRRMEEAVFRAIHAQLRSKEKRPVLRTSAEAAWVEWHATNAAPLVFRIEEDGWWRPPTEEHAATLAARLLEGIREALRVSREQPE